MARTLIYPGGLGPATITCGGLRFTKGTPVTVEDDAIAGQLLAKGCFTEEKTTSAGKAAKDKE